ncbi:MAG: hypothetical protein R3B48_21320 [Kofleriaceae bacterium]
MSGFLHPDLEQQPRWRTHPRLSAAEWFGEEAPPAFDDELEPFADEPEELSPVEDLLECRRRLLAELSRVVVVVEPLPILARRIHQVAAARWVLASGGVARSS